VSGKEEEKKEIERGLTIRKKRSSDGIRTRYTISPRKVAPGEPKIINESSSEELTSGKEEKPVIEPYSIIQNLSPPHKQYVDLVPFKKQENKQQPVQSFEQINKEIEDRHRSEQNLYYSTEVNSTTDEDTLQTEQVLTTIQEESVEQTKNRLSTPISQKVRNLQKNLSSVNTPISSSESGNDAGSEKSSGNSERNREELIATNFGEGGSNIQLINPFEGDRELFSEFDKKLAQARSTVTKLGNTEEEEQKLEKFRPTRLRRTTSVESTISVNVDDGDLLNEYISSCNISYETAEGIWNRYTENPTKENWLFLYNEAKEEQEQQSRIQEESDEDIVSQFEQEIEDAKNDESEIDWSEIPNRDHLYKFSDDSDTPSDGDQETNNVEEIVKSKLKEHKRKSKEIQDIVNELETEDSEELLEINLSSGSDTGNIFTDIKEDFEEILVDITKLFKEKIMTPQIGSGGSGSGSGGAGKIKFEIDNPKTTIKTGIDNDVPVYQIEALDDQTETFKLNGLPFYRSEVNADQWYNQVEPNREYKQDGNTLDIPMALFIGSNWEKTSSTEFVKLRLEQIEEKAKKYSKIPVKHLKTEQYELVKEYQRLKEQEMEKELKKYRTQQQYNQNQWDSKQQKTSQWSWILGDPLTHETGRNNPELQQTLSLFEEKEPVEIETPEGVKEDDIQMAKVLAMLIAGMGSNKEEHWVKLPEFNEGDDPFEWLNNYGAACVTNKIRGGRKLEHLSSVLRGSAAAWWRGIRSEVKEFGKVGSDSETFVVRFLDRFAGIENQYEWNRQLSERMQGPRESVRQFADSWKTLLRKADPCGTKNELTKVNDFARALRPELKYDTLINAPRTLNEAIRKAIWVESVRNSTGHGRTSQLYQIEEPNEVDERLKNLEQVITKSYFQKMEEITCNLCNKKGHKAINCHTRTLNMERRKQGVCFNCNKQGHMMKDCNLPRRTIACENCGKPGHPASKCWGGRNNNNSNNYNNNYNNRNYSNNNSNNRNNQRSNVPQMQQIKNINGRPMRVFYVEEDEQEENNDNSNNNNQNDNQQLVNMMDQLLSKKLKSLKA
jgi:hypothetical protein